MADSAGGQSVPPPPPATTRTIHSHIFKALVQEDRDLIGLVAYGLYQQRKRRWIANFEAEYTIAPPEEKVKDYCFSFQKKELEELRQQATDLIATVLDNLNEANQPQLISDAFNERSTEALQRLTARIDKISGYSHHIVGHVVGFLVLVGLVWISSVILHYEPTVKNWFIPEQGGNADTHAY